MIALAPWIGKKDTFYRLDAIEALNGKYKCIASIRMGYEENDNYWKLLMLNKSETDRIDMNICHFLCNARFARNKADEILLANNYLLCDRKMFQKLRILQ